MSEQKIVKIFVLIRKIGQIDTLNERFQAEISIEATWSSKEDINCEYDPSLHWNPKLYIENLLSNIEEKVKYHVKQSMDETLVIEKRYVKGIFWERLEIQNFPLDIQQLSVNIVSKFDSSSVKLLINPEKPSYLHSNAKFVFVDQQKWKLFDLVESKEDGLTFDELSLDMDDIIFPSSSKLMVSCYCARRAGYYFSNTFFLIFLISISALSIFAIDPKLPQNRLQTTCTFLLTSVSFKWVINKSLPPVSYLTSLDKYAICCIFFICINCAWHAVIGSFWEKNRATELDGWALIGFVGLFFLIHLGLLAWFLVAYFKVTWLKRKEKKFIKYLKENQKKMKNV